MTKEFTDFEAELMETSRGRPALLSHLDSIEECTCAYCNAPGSTYFLPLDMSKVYCLDCYQAMGMRQCKLGGLMRAMFGEQWVHDEPDTLFIGEKANHPAAPVHMKNLAPYVQVPIRLAIREDMKMQALIEEVVRNGGRVPDDMIDHSAVTKVMDELSADEKKVLFSKGTIYKTGYLGSISLESPQVVKLRKRSREEPDEGEHSLAEGQLFKKRFEEAADLKEK